ncbi:MAG: hypothetical protein LH629_04755 [Ignavibacteria bacterium]|nr:hypothetical protein [Ignavibacteria bacterium]
MLDILLDIHQYKKIGDAQAKAQSASDKVNSVNDRINQLEKQIDLLYLVNQAYVELFSEKLNISETNILEKIEEIDLRDGLKDGKIGNYGVKCEKCNRSYNKKLNKCLYCGYINESNVSILNSYNKK